jgi:predicted acyltransferase
MAISILPIHELVRIFTNPIAAHLGAGGAALSALSILIIQWLILFWMYKRRILIKA